MPSPLGARKDAAFLTVSKAPSINLTPVGPNQVPVGYPVVSDLADSIGAMANVRFNGNPAYVIRRCGRLSEKLAGGFMWNEPSNPDVDRFDRWAPTYDRSALQKFLFQPTHGQMLALLVRAGLAQGPECMVDVGCGTGRLLQAASVLWPGTRLHGVDPAGHMLAEARQRNPNATFSLGTAEALPQTDQSADLVVTSLSFHHWADQAQGLREVARVLRPGGWFCLADHTFLPGRWVGSKVRSRQEIQDLIQGAGLAVRQVRHLRFRLVLITLAQK